MKKGLLITIILLIAISFAYGVDPAGAVVTNINQTGPIAGSSAGTTNVTAGYIREVTLDATMTTSRWAGIFGNVSGNIQLGDSSEVMFEWAAEGLYIYASENAPDWSNLAASAGATLDSTSGYLSASDSDSATLTFAGTDDLVSNLFGTITTGYAVTATNETTIPELWETYILYDATSEYVFAGKVNPSYQNYKGDLVDFQMIVPENGIGNTVVTSYDLWVELV